MISRDEKLANVQPISCKGWINIMILLTDKLYCHAKVSDKIFWSFFSKCSHKFNKAFLRIHVFDLVYFAKNSIYKSSSFAFSDPADDSLGEEVRKSLVFLDELDDVDRYFLRSNSTDHLKKCF